MTKQYICDAKSARMADQKAIQEIGIPSLVLMENAAQAIARAVLELNPGSVNILCGPGNNGADGLAVGRILCENGQDVSFTIDENRLSDDEKIQLDIVKSLNLPVHGFEEFDEKKKTGLIIDALFGNGLSRDLEEPWISRIKQINTTDAPVLSIDLPSGIDANTGEIRGAAVQSDLCVALDCLKWGHVLKEGRASAPHTIIADIGIPAHLHEQDPDSVVLMNEEIAADFLPQRPLNANKGTFGKVLMAGGSLAMQGALSLAAKAAAKSGCGTLTCFTPEPSAKCIASKFDLAMMIPAAADEEGFFDISAKDELANRITPFTQLACGNGMGQGMGARGVLETVLAAGKPAVIDADGINLLATREDGCPQDLPLILTPHVLEFSRLIHQPLDNVLTHPLTLARDWAEKHPQAVIVLKSDWTLIVQDRKAILINEPNSALAKGGSGDVLCGIITGLSAMKMDPFKAGALGAWIHNRCAKKALSPFSFTPEDLIDNLPQTFHDIEETKNQC